MSVADDIILKAAEWAAEKGKVVYVDRVVVGILDKENFMDLKTLEQKYDSFRNLQIIRMTKDGLIGKNTGEGKLIALRVPKDCTVDGNAICTGHEVAIQQRKPIYVTAGGEFVFLER